MNLLARPDGSLGDWPSLCCVCSVNVKWEKRSGKPRDEYFKKAMFEADDRERSSRLDSL